MDLASQVRGLFARWAGRPSRVQVPARRPGSVRLRLEELEIRLCPSSTSGLVEWPLPVDNPFADLAAFQGSSPGDSLTIGSGPVARVPSSTAAPSAAAFVDQGSRSSAGVPAALPALRTAAPVTAADPGGLPLPGSPATSPAPQAALSSASPTFAYPHGVYTTWELSDSISKTKLDPGVVGITLFVPWEQVQTGAGQYNWSLVDARIQEATAAGLKVALAFLTSPSHAPAIVQSSPGVQKITLMDTNSFHSTYGTNVTAPVFWDSTFQSARLAFITAAGARYANNPTVVAATCAFANWYTDDWAVPNFVGTFTGAGNNVVLNQVQQWLQAGYTDAKMLAVGQQVLDATATAFPNQTLKLPIGLTSPELDGKASSLASQILTYAYQVYGTRFVAELDALKTTSPSATDPAVTQANANNYNYLFYLLNKYSPNIGFQMIGPASVVNNSRLNGGQGPAPPAVVLQNAINQGLTYDPNYLEIKKVDATNSTLGSILQNTTAALVG